MEWGARDLAFEEFYFVVEGAIIACLVIVDIFF